MGNKVKYINTGNVINYYVPINTEIDIDLLNLLALGVNPHFSACSYKAENNKHIFTFNTNGSYSLKNYIDNKFSNWIFFLSESFNIFNICKKIKIPLCNIMLSPDAILVRGGHVQFIVLPLNLSGKIKFDFKKILKNFISLFVLPDNIKKRLFNNIKYSLNETDALYRINEEITRLQTASVKPSENLQNLQTESFAEHEDIDKTVFSNLKDDGSTTFLKLEEEKNEEGTTFLNTNDEKKREEETTFLAIDKENE